MKKSDLWQEDLLTIILVLALIFYDNIMKEWEDLQTLRLARSKTRGDSQAS